MIRLVSLGKGAEQGGSASPGSCGVHVFSTLSQSRPVRGVDGTGSESPAFSDYV